MSTAFEGILKGPSRYRSARSLMRESSSRCSGVDLSSNIVICATIRETYVRRGAQGHSLTQPSVPGRRVDCSAPDFRVRHHSERPGCWAGAGKTDTECSSRLGQYREADGEEDFVSDLARPESSRPEARPATRGFEILRRSLGKVHVHRHGVPHAPTTPVLLELQTWTRPRPFTAIVPSDQLHFAPCKPPQCPAHHAAAAETTAFPQPARVSLSTGLRAPVTASPVVMVSSRRRDFHRAIESYGPDRCANTDRGLGSQCIGVTENHERSQQHIIARRGAQAPPPSIPRGPLRARPCRRPAKSQEAHDER